MPYTIDFNNRQALYWGTTALQAVYAGTTKVWPTGLWFSPNAAWTAAAFSGTGTKADPFVTNTQAGAADGMAIRVGSAGTIRITATAAHSDVEFIVLLNGTAFVTNGDYNGWDGSLDVTQATPANALLAFQGEYTSYTNLRIWWE